MCGQPGHNARPHAWSPTSFLGMDAWMTSKLNVALIRKLHGSLMRLAYFFDMKPNGVCTTGHWQKSGRLVQELNVCTVPSCYCVVAIQRVCNHLGVSFHEHAGIHIGQGVPNPDKLLTE